MNIKFKLIASMLITILVVIFVYSLFEYGIIRFNYPDNKMYPIVGLDISHHQGNINWNEINKMMQN